MVTTQHGYRIDRPDRNVNNAFCKHLILIHFDLNLSKDANNCHYDSFVNHYV